MIIKPLDDRAHDVYTLERILDIPNLSPSTRAKVRNELIMLKSGIKGEKEAAFEIDFNYGPSKNWAVIHDLRFEYKGRIAQIDHIVINRFLEIFVLESKRFSEGIAINENGEFSAFYGSRSYGIPSPLEQNERHLLALGTLFEFGVVEVSKRLGFRLKPKLFSLVLVSKNAYIQRPTQSFKGMENILKVDQLRARMDELMDKNQNALTLARVISSSSLEDFATALASLHMPVTRDWISRFNLPPDVLRVNEKEPKPTKALGCSQCNEKLSDKVVRFCRNNDAKFGGRLLCMNCQTLLNQARRSS